MKVKFKPEPKFPPDSVLPAVMEAFYLDPDMPPFYEMTDEKKDHFVVNGQVFIPGHQYDFNESNILHEAFNAKLIRQITLLGGPYVAVYERENPDVPAYIVIQSSEDQGGDYLWFLKTTPQS